MQGRVAIVTGASSGIGEAIARDFAARGATVVLAARRIDRLAALAAETGGLAVTCDVADEAQVAQLVATAIESFGRVDVLVNNAGVGSFGHVVETTTEAWRSMFDVNVTGTFLCSRAVLPGMLERGDGLIVNVCSDVSRRVFPGGAAYCATKHAQLAFSRALGMEVRPRGIRVAAVLPGMVETEFAGGRGDDRDDWVLRPADVAATVAFAATQPAHAVVDELVVHPVRQDYER